MFVVTALVFIGLLLVLVLVHEWGHFITAKKAGCKVEEFGFGFPPRIASYTWHGTKYSLNLLPIGGFVKIEGEDMNEENPGPTSFASKSAGWRILILSAGVMMNLILAILLLSAQSLVGVPTIATEQNAGQLTDSKSYITGVSANSPAAAAELKEYDRIVKINDIENPSIEQIQQLAGSQSEISMEIERAGQHKFITIIPRTNPPEGEGAIGISLASMGLVRWPWWQAPLIGIERSGQMLTGIVSQFAHVVRSLAGGAAVGDTLTGPIGIAVYTREAAAMGLSYLLEFAALISINLAIINILPLPALDGGRIVFVIMEKIFGRRFPGKIESITHTAGFVLLIALMIFITIKDVHRYL